METIVRGQADLMLGAGTEAVVVPLALAGFSQMKALGTPIDPDTGAYDPAIGQPPLRRHPQRVRRGGGQRGAGLEELDARHGRAARTRSPR